MLLRSIESGQYTSLAFSEALIEADITGSIGSVGDALDNALMESTIGLYKTEVIGQNPRSWTGLADVERATRRVGPVVQRRPATQFDRLPAAPRTRSPLSCKHRLPRRGGGLTTALQRNQVIHLPVAGRPVVLCWNKRIWRCDDADCA